MKCTHCEVEYSDAVLPIHQEWCGKKDDEVNEKLVDDMTVAELKAYAEKHVIDLGGAKQKDEILAKIKGV